MSHPSASHASSMPSSVAPAAERRSRHARYQKPVNANHPERAPRQSPRQSQRRAQRQSQRAQKPLLSTHRRQVLSAGGAITLLAMATILPTQVSSQSIADSNCEQVITSGAEISRGQLSSLLAISIRATRESVRQVVSEPYCTLPTISPKESTEMGSDEDLKTTAPKTIERDAYPLAFDPEAWVVLNYSAGEYQGYDFVFKP